MNEEIRTNVKRISEMMSIYQSTILSENDNENIELIQKDIKDKELQLEKLRKELNAELAQLYDNGANEIDPEVNQLQIIINEVDDLLEDIVPDILSYIQTPGQEISNQTVKTEKNIIIPKGIETKAKREVIKQTDNEANLFKPLEIEEKSSGVEKIPEGIKENNVMKINFSEENKKVPEKIVFNTIQLKQPSEDYKNVATRNNFK